MPKIEIEDIYPDFSDSEILKLSSLVSEFLDIPPEELWINDFREIDDFFKNYIFKVNLMLKEPAKISGYTEKAILKSFRHFLFYGKLKESSTSKFFRISPNSAYLQAISDAGLDKASDVLGKIDQIDYIISKNIIRILCNQMLLPALGRQSEPKIGARFVIARKTTASTKAFVVAEEVKEFLMRNCNADTWEELVDVLTPEDAPIIFKDISWNFPNLTPITGELLIRVDDESPSFITYHWFVSDGQILDFTKGCISEAVDWFDVYDVYSESYEYLYVSY